MSDLKKSWKQTAKSFLLAFNDLSVSVFDTAKAGYDAAMEWARTDNAHVQADGVEVDTAETTVSDASPAENEPNE